MARSKKNKSRSEITKRKNKFRGVIAEVKGRNFAQTLQDRAIGSHKKIKRAFVDARATLNVSQLDEFAQWAETQHRKQLPFAYKRPATFDALNGIYSTVQTTPYQELAWACARIAANSEHLNRFIQRRAELENAIWQVSNTTTQQTLEDFEKEFGQSVWLITQRIAITQHLNGLEAQKNYTKKIVEQFPRGLVGFIAHYISVRNEPSTTIHRFNEDFTDLINESSYSGPSKTYLLYRLLPDASISIAQVEQILRVEQSHTILDIYETTIDLLAHLLEQGGVSEARTLLREALHRLKAIRDIRLDRLRLIDAYPANEPPVPFAPHKSWSLLMKGQPLAAAKQSLTELRRNPADCISMIALSQCQSLLRTNKNKDTHNIKSHVLQTLRAIIDKGTDYDLASKAMQKLCRNFWAFPQFRAIHAICSADRDTDPINLLACDRRIALYTGNSLPVLTGIFHQQSCDSADAIPDADSAEMVSFAGVIRGDAVNQAYLCDEALAIALALSTIRCPAHDVSTTQQKLEELAEKVENPAIKLRIYLLLTRSYLNERDFGHAFNIICREYIADKNVLGSIPIQAATNGLKWGFLQSYKHSLTVPITLDILWNVTNDSKLATLRRFSVSQYVQAHGYSRPSEVEAVLRQSNQQQTIYFLRYLCIPPVMDMLPALTNSRALLEERRKVCALLCTVDQDNAEEYQDEIVLISNTMKIQDGQRIVDNSRVHVDEEAITRWATSNLSEYFRRYIDLTAAGIGVADDLSTLLANIGREETSEDYFEIPSSEADSLLVDLVLKLCSEFLYNKAHGLDSYLSKRIRHDSMIGHLRSPVEDLRLITQKDSATGCYSANIFWIDQATTYDDSDRLEEYLNIFAAEFDGIIVDLKDRRLHTKSPEYPDGVFEIIIPPASYHLLRSVAQADHQLTHFYSTCYTLFWLLLEPSLIKARNILLIETKARMALAFQRLHAHISSSFSGKPFYADLSSSVNEASARVQSQIDVMAGWFHRIEIEKGRHLYSLEQIIDIGVESYLSANVAFSPEIERCFVSDVSFTVADLVGVADIMRFVLGNVEKRSGVSDAPWVCLAATASAAEKSLVISVRSQVAPGVRCAESEEVVEQKRRDISDGSYLERVRAEGGSGLAKLASTVLQSARAKLEFGFESDEEFAVKIELPLRFEGDVREFSSLGLT